MQLKENEKIVKEGFFKLKPWIRKPYILFLPQCYGKIYLTNQRMIFDYFLLGTGGIEKPHGLFPRKIEVPFNRIKNIGKILPVILKLDYEENGKLRTICFVTYPFPWRKVATIFDSSATTNIIKLTSEWVEEIKKFISN